MGVKGLSYYEGSVLQLEWTNQHSCGIGANSHCEIIIQYMCGTDIRDGDDTGTIPVINDSDQTAYGQHEDRAFYELCKKTEQNKGLFTVGQNLRGSSTKYTRQNPKGNRRGLECPEERDYYPYWRPSPWIDIAILTNNVSRCPYYQAQSGNFKSKWACIFEDLEVLNVGELPITQEGCDTFIKNGKTGKWQKATQNNKHEMPTCRETEVTRDNHLGDTAAGIPMTFNWTLPNAKLAQGNCVLRIRYNVSTGDFEGWEGASTDAALNEKNEALIDVRSGLQDEKRRERGFVLKNNPQVQIFEGVDFELELAVDTAQYGRVFQDRSHVFKVKAREDDIPAKAKIHNVNIRGKRGNIVQVYPAVEYDFVPNTLMIPSDYVHFHWTGANTNPKNNDGQGRVGTDRSNVVLQRQITFPLDEISYVNTSNVGHWGNSYPENLEGELLGFSRDLKQDLALVGLDKPGAELDDASPFYDLKPQKVTKAGVYHFMSTRNNNFSNRSQKGRLVVVAGDVSSDAIGFEGGRVRVGGEAEVVVERGAFEKLRHIRVEMLTHEEFNRRLKASRRRLVLQPLSAFVVINPEVTMASNGKEMKIFLKIDDQKARGKSLKVLRSTTEDLTLWTPLEHVMHEANKTVEFVSQSGGIFYVGEAGAASTTKVGVILGVVFSLCLLAGVAFYVLKQRRKNRLSQ